MAPPDMELLRALAVLAEPPRPETAHLSELLALGAVPDPTDYVQLFVFELYPYASVYVGKEGMLGGEARDRVAGFWHALGETPPTEPDHLALLLALYAHLVDLAADEADTRRRAALQVAHAALLWEHVLSWLPFYLEKLVDLAPPPYEAWGRLLLGTLAREAGATTHPRRLPLHLREAPPLPDLDVSNPVAFLSALLAPVRSGIILTRADLARAARELGLGLRAGERLYTLRALIAQDPRGMLQWIGDEASAWHRRHHATQATPAIIAAHWARRAAATAERLRGIRLRSQGTPSTAV